MKQHRAKKVLITRPSVFCEDFASKLEEAGFKPVVLPMITTEAMSLSSLEITLLKNIHKYDWIIFASRLAVKYFFIQLSSFDLILPHSIQFACIGSVTKEELSNYGYEATFVPDVFSTKAFANKFKETNANVFIPSSDIAPEIIKQKLMEMGHSVDRIKMYKTIASKYSQQELTKVIGQGLDFITFTSNSTVNAFFDHNSAMNYLTGEETFIGIGPPTVTSLQKRKLKNIFMARPHTVGGIIKKIENLTFQQK